MRLACGCIPDASGYGYCGDCTAKLRAKIWREMPESKKNYDRYVDPNGSAELDRDRYEIDNQCCSCHINPPCSYCTSKNEEDES